MNAYLNEINEIAADLYRTRDFIEICEIRNAVSDADLLRLTNFLILSTNKWLDRWDFIVEADKENCIPDMLAKCIFSFNEQDGAKLLISLVQNAVEYSLDIIADDLSNALDSLVRSDEHENRIRLMKSGNENRYQAGAEI